MDAEEILTLQRLCYIGEAEIYSITLSLLIQTLDEIKAEFKNYFLKAVVERQLVQSRISNLELVILKINRTPRFPARIGTR